MKAKYKAEELVDKYLIIISDINPLDSYLKAAKQCAIICVDEMLDCNSTCVDSEDEFEFWKEVKLEINKL